VLFLADLVQSGAHQPEVFLCGVGAAEALGRRAVGDIVQKRLTRRTDDRDDVRALLCAGFRLNDVLVDISGRNDDVINIGGYKVAPTEVEDVALSFAGVKDCICICVSNPMFGNALKLLYQVAPDTTVAKRELAQYINTHLESYKVPRLYEQVTEVKRTYNGKLDRKAYHL
jgi:acyl-CoA synthetase (AMP-forming)/AMP-acid ligase II